MSSYQMSYLSAPTPPSTPTCNIVQISKYENKAKSGQYLQNPLIIDTNLPSVNSPTSLDILSQHNNNQLTPSYNNITPFQPSEADEESDTDQIIHTVIPKAALELWPHNPPQITLYQTDSQWIQKRKSKHKTTMDTDGEDDVDDDYNEEQDIEREPSQSSLCCTLYPFETESVKPGLHYTKTNGQYVHTRHKYNYNEYQPEGSPSTSISKPVQTAALFGTKFPKVEYLSIINDDGHHEAELSIQLPPIPSQCNTPQPESPSIDDPEIETNHLVLDVTNGMDSVSNPAPSMVAQSIPVSPETEISSIVTSFPSAIQFKRKPPPRKQSYNKYGNPFSKQNNRRNGRRSNSFQKRRSVLQGTNWDNI